MSDSSNAKGAIHPLHDWIVNHDDSWLFVVGYIGLAVILSTFVSLFWLVAVVAIHFVFEWIRQARLRSGLGAVLLQVFWELKLDLALIFFALAMSLYLELVLGMAGLGAAVRLGAAGRVGAIARAGARLPGYERALRGIILSVDDVAQAVRNLFRGTRRPAVSVQSASPEAAAAPPPGASPWGPWALPWKAGDWAVLAFGLACVLLILLAPWITEHTVGSGLATLSQQLHPLPPSG